MRKLSGLALVLALLAMPATAQDDATTNFIAFQTTVALDEKCGFFKNFERKRLSVVEQMLLAPLAITAQRQAGSLSEDDYWAEYQSLRNQGVGHAAYINCADHGTVGQYILPLRSELALDIYADLMIGFQTEALSLDQQQAGGAFEAMIKPMYEDWNAFMLAAHARAQGKIDTARELDGDDAFGDAMASLGVELPSGDMFSATYSFDELVNDATAIADDILFETIAETAGYRFRTLSHGDSGAYVMTLADFEGNRVLDLLQLPRRYEVLEGGTRVGLTIGTHADGGLRIMTYGSEAAQMARGSVTLLVNREPLGADGTDYTYLRSAEWLDAALVFKGELVDETCLGAPCFALPPEALEAILAGSRDQAVRLFLSTTPDPDMPAADAPLIHTLWTYAIWSRADYIAETGLQLRLGAVLPAP